MELRTKEGHIIEGSASELADLLRNMSEPPRRTFTQETVEQMVAPRRRRRGGARKNQRWTPAEDATLIREYGRRKPRSLARLMGRTLQSVYKRHSELLKGVRG